MPMEKILFRLLGFRRIIIILLGCFSFVCHSEGMTDALLQPVTKVDSVIKNFMNYNASYDSLTAEVYLQGSMKIHKRNIFLKLIQHFVPVGRKPDDGTFESVGKVLRFSSYYYYVPEAFNGDFNLYAQQMPEYLFVNAYASRFTAYEFVMPLSPDAFKYYTFTEERTENDSLSCITFNPKKHNRKLLSGEIIYSPDNMQIEKIRMKGRAIFSTFDICFCFANHLGQKFLPNKVRMHMTHDVLGNKVSQDLEAAMAYSKIVPSVETENKKQNLGKIRYLKFTSDSIHVVTDTSFWNKKRMLGKPILVQSEEVKEKENIEEKEDYKEYLDITKQIISPKNWKKQNTDIHYSGIISPSIIGYSGVNGFRYRQQLKISHVFGNGRMLVVQPGIEYQTKHKKFLYRLYAGYEYSPERMGMVSMNIVKDNDLYAFPDPVNPKSTLNLKYNFCEVSNRIEVFNGFLLTTSLKYREWKDRLYKTCDLVPGISINYTPKQYFWMNGRYKEYLFSPFPTLGLTVAYAIPGLKELSSHYWKVETEVFQRLRVGLSRTFNYYIGYGKRWNKGYYRPADFKGFNVRYPSGFWQDRYGCLFNNLDHDFYYVPRQYIQSQLRLEGELLLLSKMDWTIQKYIFSEHLVFSHLYTKEKPFYSEVGYGLSNDLINLTFIFGFDKCKYDSFGLRFRINFIGK